MSRARRAGPAGRGRAAALAGSATDRLAAAVALRDGLPEATQADAASRLASVADTLALELADAQRERLLAYLGLLQRWNAVYNLTAVRDAGAMLDLHLADCLAIVPALRRLSAGRPLAVLDVGSGAGLPGLVVALVQPDWTVTCIDAVAKKAAFIRQAAADLGLTNVDARHGRVEAMSDARRFDLVVSRAFASLRDFVAPTARLLAPDGVWAAMKAELSERERADVPADVDVFHVEPLNVPGLDARRCLVWMRRRNA